MADHHGLKLVSIILALVFYLATITINALSGLGSNAAIPDWFYVSSTGEISDLFYTNITPAGWTFSIWGFIYAWQAILLVYNLTLTCRVRENKYLYVEPGPIPLWFNIVYIINMSLNIIWIFLFDRSQIIASMVVIFLLPFTLYVCGVLLCRQFNCVGHTMVQLGLRADIWLTRLCVLNGIAFYGTWVTIASLLNFIMVLHHRAGVDMAICCWLALGIINAEVVTWFILETFVFDRHLRYCFSPYIVLVVALAGSLAKNYSVDLKYTQYALFLLALSGALGLVKVIVMIVKGLRNPIIYVKFSDDGEKKADLTENTKC